MKKKPNTIRQELTIGKKVIGDLHALNILLIGTSPTAVEISKNLSLLNVGSLTLCDKALVTNKDFVFPFIYKEPLIGQPKVVAIKAWLETLQTITKIEKLLADPSDLDTHIKDHEVVIACDIFSFSIVKRLDDSCLKHSKRFIYAGSISGLSFVFFNLLFIENKERFFLPEVHNIRSLSNSKPGILTLTSPHKFHKGDFISIEGLEKSLGISNEEIRPILDIVDKRAVAIEDTSLYTPIDQQTLSTAIVTGVNFPRVIKYNSVISQISIPLARGQKGFDSPLLQVQVFLTLKLADSWKPGSGKDFSALLDEALQELSTIPAFEVDKNLLSSESSFKTEFEKRFMACIAEGEAQEFDIQKILLGCAASFEVLKITGRFFPFQRPVFINERKGFTKDLSLLVDKNLLVIGAGGKTHELLKLLMAESFIRKKPINVELFDENLLTESALPSHFLLSEEHLGEKKSKALASRVNELQGYLKVRTTDTMKIYKSMKAADAVLVTFDQFNSVYEFAEMGLLSGVPVYVLTDLRGSMHCLRVTKESLRNLEQYYSHSGPFKSCVFPGLDKPRNSGDVVKWCSLLFELVFENFLLDESFFSEENSQSSFYYLVLFVKTEMYEFLLRQSPSLKNMVKLGILFFKIIFEWYLDKVRATGVSPQNGHILQTEVDESVVEKDVVACNFDFDSPQHRDFVVSFVTFFNSVYAKWMPGIGKKEVVDLFSELRTQVKSTFGDFSLKDIESDFKIKLKEITRSDKFMKYYPLRIELAEFDSIYTFGHALYEIKLSAFNLESRSSYEFDHNFFNIAWSMAVTNSTFSCLAVSQIAASSDQNTPKEDYVDFNNCKSSVF